MAERKVLITDGGSRSSVLAQAYGGSQYVDGVLAIPGNDLMYINTFGKPVTIFPWLKTTDVSAIVEICNRYNVDLVDVAQDNAVEAGVVDALRKNGTAVIGPTREAGRVEWDKAFARKIGEKAGIPQPEHAVFTSFSEGIDYVNSRPNQAYFIKASGLDTGKGALGARNSTEAIECIHKLKEHGKAAETFLIEEWLMGDEESDYEPGEEFSCFILCDGRSYKIVGYAQDHKRARTFDEGDQTGGMGSTNRPFVITPAIEKSVNETILKPFFEQMQEEGLSYTGVLYLGGMLVKRKGVLIPFVVEWNARWGDPEAQAIIPGIQNDFYEMSMAVVDRGIGDLSILSDNKRRVVVTAAARGYPGDYSNVIGKEIFGIRFAQKIPGVRFYPAGIKEVDGHHYVSGGRVGSMLGEGSNFYEAKRHASEGMAEIHIEGNNLANRTDIGFRDAEREAFASQEEVASYKKSGVVYEPLDTLKQKAQLAARSTSSNLRAYGFSEIGSSRGESAYIVDMGGYYQAFVQEGLGTKSLICDLLKDYRNKESLHYNSAWDTVAMIVNDLITVGAQPYVVAPHWAAGSVEWFENSKNVDAVVSGWAEACMASGAVYGPGETAILRDVVSSNTIEMSGSGLGIIMPKERLLDGSKLRAGDHIILVESSGIHANGISLARDIVQNQTPKSYFTKLPSGRNIGNVLLTRTYIYAALQKYLFDAGVDIHYIVNITGHGWRKLMRPSQDFTYRVNFIPEPQEEFSMLQQYGKVSDEEMYSTFNMGAGFAFYVPPTDVKKTVVSSTTMGYRAWDAGVIEYGPRRVVIKPKGIVYTTETLQIR